MTNNNKTKRYIMIDPCYFVDGKYDDSDSFYGKACNAGKPERQRAKPYSFNHLDKECFVGSTSGGDGSYAGCFVDSGQLCIVPESLANKLVIKEGIEKHMYKRVFFNKPASRLELIKILGLALRNIKY